MECKVVSIVHSVAEKIDKKKVNFPYSFLEQYIQWWEVHGSKTEEKS